MTPDHDLILVGAGLANGLIALRLAQTRPDLRVLVLERGDAPGGNHTWSFHDGDLTPAQQRWIEPLVHRRWPAYEVRFPQRRRRLGSGYASILSDDFGARLRQALGASLRCGVEASAPAPTQVVLGDGTVLTAAAVVDGRGVRASRHVALGHQAFLGRVLRTAAPHGVEVPVLMDAEVRQGQGYRFVYLLPFSADTLLVEDTHYVDDGGFDVDALGAHIDAYAESHGWRIARVLREERGVLPITLAGDFEAFWAEGGGLPRSGLAAGLYHATTGYSLPHAVRLAERIAALPRLDAASVLAATRAEAEAAWRGQAFFRLLNRMLFLAGRPQDRWRVMQRFYGLPEALIARFYAGRPTLADKARILAGKPPVPVGEAWTAMRRTHLDPTGTLQ
ncbi:lycopene beta-cyclase CrtY [Coralloluteibacterium stylophorae]|uniref:Lycopene beta-cyclase CrtY n=1 Tax=Coralloluteibacterium stylophorae TaxID=1776034 RepID=A0A8J7VSJ8_9GAMM|nr:lycopene beta-cyclase CrtY [Coralloluteibacterium stylophorae]MBS7458263.1 lycopene beta-cyclase CrtY [Coralloluteibacterium stylophorae]